MGLDTFGPNIIGLIIFLTRNRSTIIIAHLIFQQADIDELTSHRSDDRGMRRPKVQSTSQATVRKDAAPQTNGTEKKLIDRSPHEVFVQLDELVGTGEEAEWKETARWIKYEEDVEEGSDRWGRPHVASLSFHSLLNLRRCLETGVVLLDLDERDLPGVAYRVVEQVNMWGYHFPRKIC